MMSTQVRGTVKILVVGSQPRPAHETIAAALLDRAHSKDIELGSASISSLAAVSDELRRFRPDIVRLAVCPRLRASVAELDSIVELFEPPYFQARVIVFYGWDAALLAAAVGARGRWSVGIDGELQSVDLQRFDSTLFAMLADGASLRVALARAGERLPVVCVPDDGDWHFVRAREDILAQLMILEHDSLAAVAIRCGIDGVPGRRSEQPDIRARLLVEGCEQRFGSLVPLVETLQLVVQAPVPATTQTRGAAGTPRVSLSAVRQPIHTRARTATARRVFVISDLHLGGRETRMLSHPERLATFIHSLPSRCHDDELLELVINGDFIDFLALPAVTDDGSVRRDLEGRLLWDAWTPTAAQAVHKLDEVLTGPDACIFDALATHVAGHHRLTVVLGNHDIELALPAVQATLRARLGDALDHVRFVDDECPYRIGPILIEHGNRYDLANTNDWKALREIVARQARGEHSAMELKPSVGSMIVKEVVNPLKQRGYTFIDLLQPQDESIAFLLLAFEPTLRYDWANLVLLFRGIRRQKSEYDRDVRTNSTDIASEMLDRTDASVDPDLEIFADLYEQMIDDAGPRDLASGLEWLRQYVTRRKDGLRYQIDADEAIPTDQLRRIQVALRSSLVSDVSLSPDADPGSLGRAAERMRRSGVPGHPLEVVVMGHTHQPRHVGPERRATYINTGTWIDLVRFPKDVLSLAPDGHARFHTFLRQLVNNDASIRLFASAWADLRVDPDGTLAWSLLCQGSTDS